MGMERGGGEMKAGTYYVSVGRNVPPKGVQFSVCLGRGYIPLYKFWEGAQIYLSRKGSLLVWKGVVQLPLPRIGVP